MEFEKACYIAFITKKLLDVNANIVPHDDRDAYTNKKVELPGNLLGNLFRYLFTTKVIKDLKSTLTKEIHNGCWKSSGKIEEILNPSNIYKILKSTIVTIGMRSALATGNFVGGKMGIKAGISQVLNRLTYLSGISHLRRLSTPIEKTGKLLAPRKLHNTQWGYVCPAETPEGHAVGVVKNLSSVSFVSLPISSEPVVAFLYDVLCMTELSPSVPISQEATKVFVNGAWIGLLSLEPKATIAAVAVLRAAKRRGRIHPHTGITFKYSRNELWVNTEGGRLLRPLLFAPAVRELITDGSFSQLLREPYRTWDNLIQWTSPKGNHSLIEFIDPTETDTLFIAMNYKLCLEDLTYTHMEIDPSTILGTMASNIPLPHHNQAPRNCYQSSMGKQAMGIYALNFKERMDTMANILWYSSVPLVSTFMSTFFRAQSMPSGYNIIGAIMPYGGYNQEDSIILNRASLDRGLFRTEFFRTYKDEEKKNQASGEEERFCKPNPATTRLRQQANYEKLDPATGFVPVNTFVTHEDVLIGKVAPIRLRGADGAAMVGIDYATLQGMSAVAAANTVDNAGGKRFKDASKLMRTNESGYIDKIYRGRNGDGYSSVKIRIREERKIEIGDKFSSRHGQKGTVGMIVEPEDMPFTEGGIIPDIIINPHCIPSRMTDAQLWETNLGRLVCELCCLGDGTPFNPDMTVGGVGAELMKRGIHHSSDELLYCGYTGVQMPTQIFMGPCFYQRLKHMVADKVHARATGPLVMLTRQPAEGRARDGGLRVGEMERDAMAAHGVSLVLKERLLEASDNYEAHICKRCGLLAIANKTRNIWNCHSCGNLTEFSQIRIPYAYKLFLQELESMNITSRLLPESQLRAIADTVM
jgi:DNA-directed RNA polymerase II subunit RPB2